MSGASERQARLARVRADSDARWARHRAILDGDPERERHGAGSNWRARDEYAHHARWLERSLEQLRHRLDGGPAPDPADADEDEANARWQAEDRALDVDAARERCDAARRALLDHAERALDRLDDGAWALIEDDPVRHVDAHVRYLVDGLLADDDAGWQRLSAALDAAPAARVHAPPDPWEAREVYAHLARWMERATEYVRGYLDGSPPDPIDGDDAIDRWNAAWRAEDADLPFAEARRRATEAHDRIRALVASVPLERWDGTLFAVFGANTVGHYAEHLEWMGAAA